MEEFKSEDKFAIKGRGVVYVTRCPRRIEDRDNPPWAGEDVSIDGNTHQCVGVESYALGHINEGAPIGLLVKEKQ